MNSLMQRTKYYAGVEHTFSKDKEIFQYLLVQIDNGLCTIKDTASYDSFEACLKIIPKNTAVVLNINLKETLFQCIPSTFATAHEAANSCFPSLKIEDFYIEASRSPEQTIVTLCRKEIVVSRISSYTNYNLPVVSFSLGHCALSSLNPYIKSPVLNTTNSKINYDSTHQIKEILQQNLAKPTKQKLKNLSIDNRYVLAFASVVSYYTSSKNLVNFEKQRKELREAYRQANMFYFGIRSVLLFFVLVLGVSFSMSWYLEQKEKNLRQELLQKPYVTTRIKTLKEKLKSQKNIIINLSENTRSNMLLYVDSLAVSLPASIHLHSLSYQPIISKVKPLKKIDFDYEKIYISGTSTEGTTFTEWLKKLESMTWVQQTGLQVTGTANKRKITFQLTIHL